MHQGGNKSGARGPSICFHLHGRDAKMAGGAVYARMEGSRSRQVFARDPRILAPYLWGLIIEKIRRRSQKRVFLRVRDFLRV